MTDIEIAGYMIVAFAAGVACGWIWRSARG